MHKYGITILIGFLLSSATVHSQDFSRVDSWLKKNTPQMGGRSVLVIYKDGKLAHSYVVNDMNLRQQLLVKAIARRQGKEADIENFSTVTRLPVASCSKWYSAALVMTFIDEGKLALGDTVGKFLPVLSQHGKGNITISECLSHTTGIKAPPLRDNIEEVMSSGSMDESIARIAELGMEGEHGKVFHYSNTGLQIAGAVIEKISGKSFDRLFEERLARPLDMQNTDFGKGKVALPAGGAQSTPMDYLHFLVMIMDKGMYNGKRILSEKSVAAMQVNRIDKNVKIAYSPAEAGNFGYGFGEWVMETYANSGVTRTVTSPGLFGSFPWVDNENRYCAFLMCYYIKNEGRNQRYKELKSLVDAACSK